MPLISQLLDPLSSSGGVVESGGRLAMADAIHLVFLIALIAATLGWIVSIFTPLKEFKDNISTVAPAIAD